MFRVCRYEKNGRPACALYEDERLVDLQDLERHRNGGRAASAVDWENSLTFLPHGGASELGRNLYAYWNGLSGGDRSTLDLATNSVRLLPPMPIPPKFLLLAGNYAEHIEEGGMKAEEREDTFPYVF